MPPVNNQLGFQNFLSGKLTADVTAIATDVFIDTVPAVSEGFLVIDPLTPASREVIFFTSKTSTKVSTPAVGGRGVDGTTGVPHFNGTTYIMAPVAAWFNYLQNGQASTDPIRTQTLVDFIFSGGIVAQSAGLVGTFSNIIYWQRGVQYSGNSIANKTYTASKDTYVDILGNSDGTTTVAYTEVANNAASPALTTNYTRVAIVVTSGAAITFSNQGQVDGSIANFTPSVSSIQLTVTDSLGNLIYPTDPQGRMLSQKRNIVGMSGVGTSVTQITGLLAVVNIPGTTPRKIKLHVSGSNVYPNSTGALFLTIWKGLPGVGTQIGQSSPNLASGTAVPATCDAVDFASGNQTYSVGLARNATGTVSMDGSASAPIIFTVEVD